MVTIFLASLPAGGLTGCGASQTDVPNPIPVAGSEYEQVFEATVDVLRDNRFRIARQDRRFGVITTEPRTASMALERWHPDRTTSRRVLENTLNHQRYTIVTRLRPREDSPEADGENGSDSQPSAASEGNASTDAPPPEPVSGRPGEARAAGYELAIEARLERRQLPPRTLHTAAVADTRVRRKAGVVRPLRTASGPIEPHWRTVGRDREYERRLVATILTRATGQDPRPAPADPAASPPASDPAGRDDTGRYEPYQPKLELDPTPEELTPQPRDPLQPAVPRRDDAPVDPDDDSDAPDAPDAPDREDDGPPRYQPYPGEAEAGPTAPGPLTRRVLH